MMMVEEIDIEDFCLDGELEEHTTTSRTNEDVAAGDRGSGLCSGVAKFGGGGNLQRHRLGGPGDKSPRAITESEALGVRELIFGDCGMRFNDAWREQGFYFCQGVSGLGYGLVQAEGGPCGVLAAVQAFLLEVHTLLDSVILCPKENFRHNSPRIFSFVSWRIQYVYPLK